MVTHLKGENGDFKVRTFVLDTGKAVVTGSGGVNFDDLIILAQNYNKALPGSILSEEVLTSIGGASFAADWALAQSLVPEPTSLLAVAGLLSVANLRRR